MTKYFNAFNQIPGIGPRTFKKLTERFGTLERAWNAPSSELKTIFQNEESAAAFAEKRKKTDPDEEMEKVEKAGVQIITVLDENYPRPLREIPNPPALIYVKGRYLFSANGAAPKPAVAVVGARKFTQYGKAAAEKICLELARNGIIIVSGLALGIDAIAHRYCLEGGSETIAVLGTGLNKIYPPANAPLAKKIIEKGGCVISEYPIEMGGLKQNFPQRNRIISGLSLGTLVIEAKEKSGSLITANFALEQNREIFAVPGSIFSKYSDGTNNLLKEGARPVSSAEDILKELNIEPVNPSAGGTAKKYEPKTAEEKIILEILEKESNGGESVHIDKITKLSKLSPSKAGAIISLLELKGAAKNIGGGNYRLTNN